MRVYTKATKRLEEMHRNYRGFKTGCPDTADFFDNTNINDETGGFSAILGNDPSYYIAKGYVEVSEQEFINIINNKIPKKGNIQEGGDSEVFNPQPHYDNSKGSLYKKHNKMKKMYTKATPTLKELWEKYEGEKWVTTDHIEYVDYFDNLAKYSDDSPSCFYGFESHHLDERLEHGYVEVSEREFAKFFDLEKELDEWYAVRATSGTQINTPYLTETVRAQGSQHILEAYKEKDGKITWEVDFEFLEEIAKRMDASAKYPPYNWHKPIDHRELLKAGWRHYVQLMKGHLEDDGQEYGHIFAVVTNLMMAYYQLKLKQNG